VATIHIGAEKGAIAEVVLMPGDPRRAELIAERYLEAPSVVNRLRGMTGITGTCRGQRLSLMAHGMGMPSMGIYASELIREFGVRTLIRIGSCGALQQEVRLRDLVLAQAASTDSNWQQQYGISGHLAPCASWELLSRAAQAAGRQQLRFHVGGVLSSDVFYPDAEGTLAPWAKLGLLAVEMETAALYMIAARQGVRALSILTVSDSVQSGTALSAEERERTFSDMVEVALAALAPAS
jgi:purine-nucleoside phosphorylase